MSRRGQDPYQASSSSPPPHGSYNYAYDNYGHPFDNNRASGSQPSQPPPLYRPESDYSKYSQYPDEEIEAFDIDQIDPALRLRTTKTAHSVIAESIRSEGERVERRRSRLLKHLKRHGTTRLRSKSRRGRKHHGDDQDGGHDRLSTIPDSDVGESSEPPKSSAADSGSGSGTAVDHAAEGLGLKKKTKPLTRRSIYVNMPLPSDQLNPKGEPIVDYARNKVRTSKYTLLTFLPRNLFEQFYRVANIYFLVLVILQLFSIFGATTPEIAMLPLVAILGMTAIKDGIEDWRRAQLDEEVNTSAATKLGNWKNYNQPTDPRNWFERLFHMGPDPTKPSKGVRKLREKEAKEGKQVVFERHAEESEQAAMEHLYGDGNDATEVVDAPSLLQPPGSSPPFHALKGVQSVRLPSSPDADAPKSDSLMGVHPSRGRAISNASSSPSTWSRRSTGVIDYSKSAPGTAQWERTLWKKLEVGDIVLLRGDEQVPADLMVLSTSDADNLCFVETKNLDGETNLKVRKAVKATASIGSEEDLEHARFVLDSEPPHANLYSYNGVLKYRPAADSAKVDVVEEIEAITINEILLRGCTLRNTKWVIGLVVFTGADTKIMMNGGDTPSKRSKIEKETNFNVIMNFIILILLCLVTALLHGYYRSLDNQSANYYEQHAQASDNIYLDSVVIFVSSLIVFQNIVPISLYITVEIVKTIQAYFIYQDIEMYYAPFDTPCVPKTWNISDDLGQIEYVFSDKTGTLTQNVMEFKKCSIGGITFGEGITEASLGALKRQGKDVSHTLEDQEEELKQKKDVMLDQMKRLYKNRYLRDDKLTLIAPELPKYLGDKEGKLREKVIAFFRALALCHTVLSDKPEPEDKPYVLDYKAESPDEEALVAAARDVGFPFVARNSNKVDIEVLGKPERWIPLRVLEFNSTRKRMSTVMRSPDGQVVLFCKGADSVIYERLAKDHDEGLKQSTLKDLEAFANGGLRTLCIAYRNMSEEEFSSWSKKYDAACASVEDREGEIDKACEMIEHSLEILGATALEDKLQQGVPDAIEMLHKAGIKLWILTGDKLQTAIEIGYSCNLLTNDMEVMIISADSAEGARAQIEAGLNKMASVQGPPATKSGGRVEGMDPSATFAVVIDGESLRYALSPELKPLFLSLGTQCSAVICCRVSPAQKAQTVKLVKDGCNAMTLSIGDGANDVAMIQEANIGVGLFGLEGSQAAMSADYAFGQFRFLTRLLLVHGRWSYVRIADMHANFFYKNVVWTVCMFWFLIYSSFDATYMFQYTFIMLYNLVFTSLPVGILGAFDQDTNARVSMAFPQLYKRGILGLEYTRFRFWIYMADGLYQSAIVFFIPLLVYWDGASWSAQGWDTNDMYDLSSTIAAAAVIVANLYVGINTRYWTIIPGLVIPLSTFTVFVWIALYSVWAPVDYYGVVNIVVPTFNFWFTILLTVALAVGPHWLLRAFRQSYMYLDKDIVREAWVGGTLKDELGVPHRKNHKRRMHRDLEEARYHKRSEGMDAYAPASLEMTQVSSAVDLDPLLDSGGSGSLRSPTDVPSLPGSPDPRRTPTRPPRAPVHDTPEHAPPYEYNYNGADSPYSRGGGSPDFENEAVQQPRPTRSNAPQAPPSSFPQQYGWNSTAPAPTTRQRKTGQQPQQRDTEFSEVMTEDDAGNQPQQGQQQGHGYRPPSTAAGDFTKDTQWANRPPSEADPAFAGYAV